MAVGKHEEIALEPIDGIRVAAVSAGIKSPGRLDVVLMEICEGATVAGAYTKNAFCAAPVVLAKQHSAETTPRYFLVNTGNANAGTGDAGLNAAGECCNALASESGTNPAQVLPFSTGVIGEPLPIEKIETAIPGLIDALREEGV